MKKKKDESAPAPASINRQPLIVIVAGRNGAGKTTLARVLVSKHRKAFVIAPSREWGEWGNVEALALKAIQQGSDALVLDDADAYLPSNPSPFWVRLFNTNRHLGLDVLLLTRRPQALPYWAVAAAARVYLFPMGPREKRWCELNVGTAPPESGFTPKVVTL
jgi:hypothetical protein